MPWVDILLTGASCNAHGVMFALRQPWWVRRQRCLRTHSQHLLDLGPVLVGTITRRPRDVAGSLLSELQELVELPDEGVGHDRGLPGRAHSRVGAQVDLAILGQLGGRALGHAVRCLGEVCLRDVATMDADHCGERRRSRCLMQREPGRVDHELHSVVQLVVLLRSICHWVPPVVADTDHSTIP